MPYTLYPPKNTPRISLEFTSPSNPMAEKAIFNAALALKHYQTDFSCVNFGGDVLVPTRAIDITQRLYTQHRMPIVGYLRRSNISQVNFDKIANAYIDKGINRLFITEGRRLGTTAIITDHYASLIDAVKALKQKGDFKISIEARPEHNSSEIEMIKILIELGVHEIITRFTFNPTHTLKFLEKIQATHTLPKVRIGVLPFESPSKGFLTAHRLNVAIPNDLQKLFSQYPDDDAINLSLGMHLFLKQIQIYMKEGYERFHVRFGRSHLPIESLCRYYNIAYRAPCDTSKKLQFLHSKP